MCGSCGRFALGKTTLLRDEQPTSARLEMGCSSIFRKIVRPAHAPNDLKTPCTTNHMVSSPKNDSTADTIPPLL